MPNSKKILEDLISISSDRVITHDLARILAERLTEEDARKFHTWAQQTRLDILQKEKSAAKRARGGY